MFPIRFVNFFVTLCKSRHHEEYTIFQYDDRSGSVISIVILCNEMNHYNTCILYVSLKIVLSHHIKDTVQRRDLHAVTLNMIIIVTMVEVVARETSTVVL